jgi:hypothetical protein
VRQDEILLIVIGLITIAVLGLFAAALLGAA